MKLAYAISLLLLLVLPIQGQDCIDDLAYLLRSGPERVDYFSLDALENNFTIFKPGQSSYGLPKIAYIHHFFTFKALDKILAFLEKKKVDVIEGPDGRLWIKDRHHHFYGVLTGLAILKRRFPESMQNFKLKVMVGQAPVGLDEDEFKVFLRDNNYIYLKPSEEIDDLPQTADLMQRSYKRGLAYLFIKAGLVDKVDEPFSDFSLGKLLAKHLGLKKNRWDDAYIDELINEFYSKHALFAGSPGHRTDLPKPDEARAAIKKYLEAVRWYLNEQSAEAP